MFVKLLKLSALLMGSLVFLAPAAQGMSAAERKLEESVWVGPNHELLDTINAIGERIQKDPYSSFDHYLLSHAYIRLFNEEPTNLSLIKKANDLAQQAIELAPSADYGTVALANILAFMGQPARGIKYIGEVLDAGISPRSWRIYLMLGQLNEEISDVDVQLTFYKKAMLEKNSPRSIIVPFVIERLKGAYEGEMLTRHLFKWNDEFSHHHFEQEIAVSYAQTQKYDASDKIFKKLNRGKHKSLATLTNHAILLYQHLNRPWESIKALKAAKKMLSVNDSYHEDVIDLHLGATYLKLNNQLRAAKIYKKLLLQHKFQKDMAILIEKAYDEAGKPQKYLNLLAELSEKMGSADLYMALGKSAERLAKYSSAIDAFRKALIIEPNSGETYNLLGLALYKHREYNEALAQFDIATRITPTSSSAFYNKACMLSILQRGDEAISALENALLLDPNLKSSAIQDKDFHNIKDLPQYKKLMSPAVVAH